MKYIQFLHDYNFINLLSNFLKNSNTEIRVQSKELKNCFFHEIQLRIFFIYIQQHRQIIYCK